LAVKGRAKKAVHWKEYEEHCLALTN